MATPRLTDTSYVVLGLVEHMAPVTPYALKQMAAISTTNFWSVPHTQIYTECSRLAEAGLLSEEREQTGRRRRIYRLTEAGGRALERWRSDPSPQGFELRDVATLKLFFGADPKLLAESQVRAHTTRLENYEQIHAAGAGSPPGWRRALEAGIGHEREFIRFWTRLAESKPEPQ
ncbi:MAG TPA: PadR family transcriptional regulator [Solirubrobacteraceae bacterium]|jgi:DNA-binding PadR family transcriptional regulator